MMKHIAILTTNRSDKRGFIERLLHGHIREFDELREKKGALFSSSEVDKFLEEEERHDRKILTANISQPLKTLSGGERKKALLDHLLQTNPDYILLDNPFDNLDKEAQTSLTERLETLGKKTTIIQLASRNSDVLPFIHIFYRLERTKLVSVHNLLDIGSNVVNSSIQKSDLPPAPLTMAYEDIYLIEFRDVSVSYGTKPILNQINWEIRPGEFWQLAGKNGSGKTTLLSLITGDNPKGYGQDIVLFGRKKGSGESVWEIKEKIGYFTPAMIDQFRGYHTVSNMLISGLVDSIGLYIEPDASQIRLADQWLSLLDMTHYANSRFGDLTVGQKHLILCARAMIKHPLLLILDEPTAGLDDKSAVLVVTLVNKMASESTTAIIFVSHRKEPGLKPDFQYELTMRAEGSKGLQFT